MTRYALLSTFAVAVVALALLAGCQPTPAPRPSAAPPVPPVGPPGEASAPADLTEALSATWTARVDPVGETSDGAHADFDLDLKADLRNTSRAALQAGRQGYVILDAPNLELAPLSVTDFGGFAVAAGRPKSLAHQDRFKARVEGRKLFLRKLEVRVACTAPLAVAGGGAQRVVVVGEFPRSAGSGEPKTAVWPYTEGFLRAKADGRDEWAARLARKLLEDRAAERG